MTPLYYTLIADGSSDRALIPLLTWLLVGHQVERPIQPQWADLGRLPNPPRTLQERVEVCLQLYPCEILFIHRDAENAGMEERSAEIALALEHLSTRSIDLPVVVEVIPVRMLEAWLLFSEYAIRAAAANSNGRQPLALPTLRRLEEIVDPKQALHSLLRTASGLHGRRLKSFPVHQRAIQVADHIDDFSPLRELPAFQRMESLLAQALSTLP